MHLPDHFLDPATMAISAAISSGAVAYSVLRVRKEGKLNALPAAGVAAAIFAAQMVNFPVGDGTSGHLVGGALAGMLLGPWAGVLAMSAVLAVQAVVFGDGGILALGANVLNMGLIGVGIGVAVDRLPVAPRKTLAGSLMTRASAAGLAGWLSVVAAALACAIEMALSGAASAGEVVPAMLGVHALIGLAEGAITAILVLAWALVLGPLEQAENAGASWLRRPSAVHCSPQAVAHNRHVWFAMLVPAALVVVALAPFASTLPDGLESVAASLSSLELRDVATVPSVLTDYAVPGVAWSPIATAFAGVIGIALVYGVTAVVVFNHRRNGDIL